ncbi:MAG: LLM class flavin-dependent oxidoreductase [Chloroflexota bacterium]
MTDVPKGRGSLQFSLFYFGNYEADSGLEKYELIFEAARFADDHGFSAIWTPERHFHSFGGFSPNPSVLSAALARETEHIQLRAGSVVLPLHHPLRVAEEWSVVDNISQGRVGVSFASGWHPNDFVFAPDAFGQHRERMFQAIETLQKAWRGEAIEVQDGGGKPIQVTIYPRPVQQTLPIWITAVKNPNTYRRAGELGAGILTNLMGQTIEELAENVALYRQAAAKTGQTGHVTLLLHTFVGDDLEVVRETARQPFNSYLNASVGLFKTLTQSVGHKVDLERLTEEDRSYLLDVAYEQYVQTRALIGTPASCGPILDKLQAIGVDEVACFVDFGIAPDLVLQGLTYLDALKNAYS